MKFYRGDKSKDFTIENKLSRYNLPCLFFSNSIELAKKYQDYFNGYLYDCEIFNISKTIDFDNKITYSSEFRNLILKLALENHQSVLIKNCIDYPSDVSNMVCADILVVFDFDIIKNLKLIHSD